MPDAFYPCDAGTGHPVGFHHFEANHFGMVVCTLCGARPRTVATSGTSYPVAASNG